MTERRVRGYLTNVRSVMYGFNRKMENVRYKQLQRCSSVYRLKAVTGWTYDTP
jgi:hypothetical protein